MSEKLKEQEVPKAAPAPASTAKATGPRGAKIEARLAKKLNK